MLNGSDDFAQGRKSTGTQERKKELSLPCDLFEILLDR